MKIKPIFRWYDFWIGLFYNTKKKTLYFFPVPMVGLKITWKTIRIVPDPESGFPPTRWFRID